MRTCPQCGAELAIEHPKGPTMWVERCTACSYSGGGTVSFGIDHSLDPDADTDVTGYFQLSDLSQFTKLRTLLPELQSKPSVDVIKRLRADGLRWHIVSLKKWRAQRYKREASDYGLEFIIVA
jgi:hypothetical protein